jgi:hypothetical protein
MVPLLSIRSSKLGRLGQTWDLTEIEGGEHALRWYRRSAHRFHPQPDLSGFHIKQQVGIEPRRHVLAQSGPVPNLLGGAAVVADTVKGNPCA